MLISYKIFIHPIIIALIGLIIAHYINVLFINQFTLFKHLIHLVSNFHSYLFPNPCVNITLFQDSSRSIANILGENVSLQVLPEPDLEESDQSILDQHVLRIWKDKTPLRSPGDPAGRPLSPGGGYRRGKSQAMSSSLGPMQPHRLVFLFENEQIQPHRLVFIYQFSLLGWFLSINSASQVVLSINSTSNQTNSAYRLVNIISTSKWTNLALYVGFLSL